MALERVPGGWRVRLRYGANKRARFLIPLEDRAIAEAREKRLQALSALIAKCRLGERGKELLEGAAGAKTDAVFAGHERAIREICDQARPKATVSAKTFRDVARLWTSGELAKRWPDRVRSREDGTVWAANPLAQLLPKIGDIPIDQFTLEDGEQVLADLADVAPNTRRRYAQAVAYVLKLAAYPLRLIERSPLPPGFVPPAGQRPAYGFLYPEEDSRLLAHAGVPFVYRLLYGLLAREGMRISEALGLVWANVDLVRESVTLDRNKTDQPRSWALTEGVAEALAFARGSMPGTEPLFTGITAVHAARRFREHLLEAGITRDELFARTRERRPLRVHDLRSTFVTLSLANDKTEAWVMDRTGHTTSRMLAVYRRQARFAQEVGMGELVRLDLALPELGQRVGKPRVTKAGNRRPYDNCQFSGESRQVAERAPIQTVNSPATHAESGQPSEAGQRDVGQTTDPGLRAEMALAEAACLATEAQQWDLAMALTRELGERRRARTAPEVPSIERARARKDGGER